jgi:hypothetical protein
MSGSKQTANGYSASVNPFQYAYFANPYERLYDENGDYQKDFTYWNFKSNNHANLVESRPENGFNIMREINETDNKNENTSFSVNASLNYRIHKNLSFSGVAAYSYTTSNSENFKGKNTYAAFKDRCYFDNNSSKKIYSSYMTTDGRNNSYTLRGQLSYSKIFNEKHRLNILGGTEIRESNATAGYKKRFNYDNRVEISAMPVPTKPANTDYISYSEIVSYANMMDG